MGGGAPLAFLPDGLQLFVGQVLDADEGVLRRAHSDEFVQLDLDCGAIAVKVLSHIMISPYALSGRTGRCGFATLLARLGSRLGFSKRGCAKARGLSLRPDTRHF